MDFSQICRRREGWSVPLRLDILNKFYTKSPILDPSNIGSQQKQTGNNFCISNNTDQNIIFFGFSVILTKRKCKIFLWMRSHLVDVEIHHHWLFPAPRSSERGQGVRERRDKKSESESLKKVWKWKQCHGWGSLKVGLWRVFRTERLTKWEWKFDVWRLYFALGYFSFDVSEKDTSPPF